MSTPMARPVAPTLFAARKTSKPAPQPKSMTHSPCNHGMLVKHRHDFGTGASFLSKTSYCEGVATAEAEVGVTRDVAKLLFGVAECLSYGARIGGLISPSERTIMVLNTLVDGARVHGAEIIKTNNGAVESMMAVGKCSRSLPASHFKSFYLYVEGFCHDRISTMNVAAGCR
jgi:hypothetical protein